MTLPLFLCLLFSDAPILKLRPLRLLGQISFSVYLLQYLVLFAALSVGSRFHTAIHSPPFIGLGAAGIVAALIVLSSFTYRYVERPGIHWAALGQRRFQAQPSALESQATAVPGVDVPG